MQAQIREESPNLMLARYHSPALGRFLSVDPGFDVQPENPQSWNFFAYVRNSPINSVDPDGAEERRALAWMQGNLIGVPAGDGAQNMRFKRGAVPKSAWCYDAVFLSYRNAGPEYRSMPASRVPAIEWFKQGGGSGGPARHLETDVAKGQPGDVLFMGGPKSMEGHSVLVQGVTMSKDGSTATIDTVGQFGATDANGNPIVSQRTFTATKNDKGQWVMSNGQQFVGYGQVDKKQDEVRREEPGK